MLKYLWGRGLFDNRKARLLSVAVFQASVPSPKAGKDAYKVAVRYADNLASLEEVRQAFPDDDHDWIDYYLMGGAAFPDEKWPAEVPKQATLLHELFGNPFCSSAVSPEWRTSDVMALAKGIYEERAFDSMPILADALQDAGCDCDDILNHLRDPNATHVRGCWVLDLVLGKE
jgi:hypothetical protein